MTPKLPVVTCRELIKALKEDGFVKDRQVGSHLTLRHPIKDKYITVPNHPSDTVPKGTLNRILKDSQISRDELNELLK